MVRTAKFIRTTKVIKGVSTDMAKNGGFPVPQQDKYPQGDDGWGLKTNACPIDSPTINTQPGNGGVLASVQKLMTPVTDDMDSSQCYDSTTKG